MLTSLELQQIYSKAKSLQEHLKYAAQAKAASSKDYDKNTLSRISKWRQLSSDGDQKLFERRHFKDVCNAGTSSKECTIA